MIDNDRWTRSELAAIIETLRKTHDRLTLLDEDEDDDDLTEVKGNVYGAFVTGEKLLKELEEKVTKR